MNLNVKTGERRGNKYRGGTSDATTSSLIIGSMMMMMMMMMLFDFLPSITAIFVFQK